jgi:formylmethanofuran dehydrogenase subunit A
VEELQIKNARAIKPSEDKKNANQSDVCNKGGKMATNYKESTGAQKGCDAVGGARINSI